MSGIDLSRDYTDYEESWELTPSEGLTITCHGHEKGKVVAAEWSDGKGGSDNFCLLVQSYDEKDLSMTESQILKLVTEDIK